ncbi:GFA family protein [Pelagibius marinus]|uniref:GFA family protein n=1 Tax=Pelagibius marinus TaxID=2762760 RepID=UPI001872340F|nr:GFA family protein [Pelagibius marinus]
MTTRGGRCLCGDVTYEYNGPENWRAYCHCESCRRNTASPVTAFFGVPRAACRFTGKAPSVYKSSPGVRRLFCGRCGSPMAYESDRFPDEIHLYAASLDRPEDYVPQGHVHCAEQLPWFDVRDDLPRYPGGSSGD